MEITASHCSRPGSESFKSALPPKEMTRSGVDGLSHRVRHIVYSRDGEIDGPGSGILFGRGRGGAWEHDIWRTTAPMLTSRSVASMVPLLAFMGDYG